MTEMNQQTSRFLDMARGIAAFAVLLVHAQVFVLVTMSSIPPENRSLLAWIAWFFYGYGHYAVVVFFVLSGFLVGGSAVSRASNGERFLKTYLIDRTVRIYTVLVPALILTALLDTVGRRLFKDTGIYDLPVYLERSDLGTFIANLFNVQNIFAKTFGTNDVLWTLGHEYWYYVSFGLIMVWFCRAYSPRARWAALVTGCAITVCMSVTLSYHLFGFALWLVGVAAARLPRPMIKSRQAALAFVVIVVGFRLGMREAVVERSLLIAGAVDATVALSFANLLLSLRFDDGPVWRVSQWRIHRLAAEFSFSLYAIHLPILTFLCAASQHHLGIGWHSVPTSPAYWGLLVGMIVLVVACCRIFWGLTEAYSPSLRVIARQILSQPAIRSTQSP